MPNPPPELINDDFIGWDGLSLKKKRYSFEEILTFYRRAKDLEQLSKVKDFPREKFTDGQKLEVGEYYFSYRSKLEAAQDMLHG